MTEKSAKEKIYLLLVIFLALTLAVVFLVVSSLTKQIKNGGRELAEQRQDLNVFYQNWQNLEKSRQETEKIGGDLNDIQPFLAKKEILKFIVAIEEIAQKTDNRQSISVINPPAKKITGEETQKDTADKEEIINFQILLKGDFPNLMKFLAYLENLPFAHQIQLLTINRLNQSSIIADQESGLTAGDISTVINLTVPTQ